MSNTQTIVGTLISIEEKASGWTRVNVAKPGSQYPLRLDTKIEKLIEDARATKGETAEWTFKETESENVNPNSGKPYVNRYLEGVTPVTTASGNGAPEQHHESLHFADKDRLITRQTCLKAATALLSGRTDLEDIGKEAMAQAQRFEQWLYRDIDPVPFV